MILKKWADYLYICIFALFVKNGGSGQEKTPAEAGAYEGGKVGGELWCFTGATYKPRPRISRSTMPESPDVSPVEGLYVERLLGRSW